MDGSMRAIARLYSLHQGEISVLAAAQRLNKPLVLTDDAAARLAAISMRVPAHGTLGILLRSVRRQQRTVPEIVRVLQHLPSRSSLHIRQCVIDSAIEQLRANEP